ncbi:MAG: hypothetical protein JWN46_2385 [Acidimicrobiales bacterium]|nr:hypothetical protein [Acidimicrobiales bacterium]
MRIDGSVTSLSWIPSEAVKGMTKLPFEMGVARYDPPPPEQLDDVDALQAAGRFRFAQRLDAWIEVDDGGIVDHGSSGHSWICETLVGPGERTVSFRPVSLPSLEPDPEVGARSVRFTRTAGGRTGVPAPRHVRRPPFVQIAAPLAWSTVSLVLHADGRCESSLAGASPFPRHWIYGSDGHLVAKTGLIDFTEWYRTAFGSHSPWGDEDSPALVTAVETALERSLSSQVMHHGHKPTIKKLKEGRSLTEQGAAGDELYLLLDGVLRVEVDGEALAEVGPGALLGERALLEGGTRTSTLRAVTACTVAVASAESVDRAALAQLAEGHRREDQRA